MLPDSHVFVLVKTEHALAPIRSLDTLSVVKHARSNVILQKCATRILNAPFDATACVQINVVLKDWPFYFGG